MLQQWADALGALEEMRLWRGRLVKGCSGFEGGARGSRSSAVVRVVAGAGGEDVGDEEDALTGIVRQLGDVGV